jgi:ABC-type glycerol-3-phosphate transport system permease component
MTENMARKKYTDPVFGYGKYLFALILVIITLFPIFWLFRMSIIPSSDLITLPPKMFFLPDFNSFVEIFNRHNFGKYIINSIVVALFSTSIGLIVGLPAAYSFSRFQYRGKSILSILILCLYVMPPVAMVLPFYAIFNRLGIAGTRLGLVLTHSIITVPLSVWMLRGFISRLPVELEDAARIDGCNRIMIILYVLLPILKPGIAATMILSFIYSWNDFIYAVILTSSDSMTIPVMIAGFITDKAVYWDRIASAGVLVILPPLILSIIVQPYLAEGLSAGATKG